MADEPIDSMYDEVDLSSAEFAEVTSMLDEVRAVAGAVPPPEASPELARMLAVPPVRRSARRRRVAAAAGAAALTLGSLGGAAAADVLPEPVRGVVGHIPGMPGPNLPKVPDVSPAPEDDPMTGVTPGDGASEEPASPAPADRAPTQRSSPDDAPGQRGKSSPKGKRSGAPRSTKDRDVPVPDVPKGPPANTPVELPRPAGGDAGPPSRAVHGRAAHRPPAGAPGKGHGGKKGPQRPGR